MTAVEQHESQIDGLPVSWRSAPHDGVPTLFVHGVPNSSAMWDSHLEQIGGIAVDLPGFGRSGKPQQYDYSIAGYEAFLERFVTLVGLDRLNLVMHDWGAAALAWAQNHPRQVERLVLIDAVPLLPGYRWHRIARAWRTPVLGELLMGSTTKTVLRLVSREANVAPGPLPAAELAAVYDHFDHGTQRAILKLYRSAPPDVLARGGERLDQIDAPSLVIWGARDPYIPARFARAYADALGGSVDVEVCDDAGHWPWLDRPDLIGRLAAFVDRA